MTAASSSLRHRTLREVGPRFQTEGQLSNFGALVRPAQAIAFSPDGKTLAVGDSDGLHATLYLVNTRNHRRRAYPVSALNAFTPDVAFAPDGRTVITGEAVSGHEGPPSEVLFRRDARSGDELARSDPIAEGRMAGLARHGQGVLVTSGPSRSFLLDVHTLEPVKTFPIGGVAAVSPDGAAAFGHDDGTVSIVDMVTGRIRRLTGRVGGSIEALSFSAEAPAGACKR